jgi:hypothetical protein
MLFFFCLTLEGVVSTILRHFRQIEILNNAAEVTGNFVISI